MVQVRSIQWNSTGWIYTQDLYGRVNAGGGGVSKVQIKLYAR